MSESRINDQPARPAKCPFCQGKAIDTLAKTITPRTLWRCRDCEETWTLASRPGFPARSPSSFSY
jgi:ribosomal protein L37AE/L43A